MIEIVYLMINNIKKEGPKDFIFNEMKVKSGIDFQNYSKCDSVRLATQIGRRMNYMVDD